jgi:hypothetical protein
VPVPQTEDADARSYRLKAPQLPTEPEEGWPQSSRAFQEMVRACSSRDDLDRLQDASRPLLASLSREQPQLYRRLGQAIVANRAEFALSAEASSAAVSQNASLSGPKTRASVRREKNSPAAKPNGSGAHS